MAILLSAAVTLGAATADKYASSQDWPVAGGRGGVRYSTLAQINKENVGQLQRAWQFDSSDEFEGSEMECNPIVLDGVVYATTPRLRVVALDGATGKLLWDFDAHRGKKVIEKQRNRGLVYWGNGDERRLFVGIDSYPLCVERQDRQAGGFVRGPRAHRSARRSRQKTRRI